MSFIWLEFSSFVNHLLFITLLLYTLHMTNMEGNDMAEAPLVLVCHLLFFCPRHISDWHLPDMVSPSWTGSIWRTWLSQSPKTWTSSYSIPSCCTAMRDVSRNKGSYINRHTSCLPVSHWCLQFLVLHILNKFRLEHNICIHRNL